MTENCKLVMKPRGIELDQKHLLSQNVWGANRPTRDWKKKKSEDKQLVMYVIFLTNMSCFIRLTILMTHISSQSQCTAFLELSIQHAQQNSCVMERNYLLSVFFC